MSTLVFVSESSPEKNVEKIIKYKAYLSKEQKDEILEQIPNFNEEDWHVNIHVEIELKKYKKK